MEAAPSSSTAERRLSDAPWGGRALDFQIRRSRGGAKKKRRVWRAIAVLTTASAARTAAMAEHPINSKHWHDVYGEPRPRTDHPLRSVSVDELTALVQSGTQRAGTDFLVVDVRRADCEVSARCACSWARNLQLTTLHLQTLIPGAINLPAHSLPAALPGLLPLLSRVPLVVFHCNRSNGRGPRSAGWYADALQAHLALSDADVSARVAILAGGIVAWEERHGVGELSRRGKQDGLKTVQL
jgi:rhodanese-related sulfurtransferase